MAQAISEMGDWFYALAIYNLLLELTGRAEAVAQLESLRGKGENPIGVSQIDAHGWIVLAIGFVVSFIVAYASVAWFMAWVRKRGFTPFAIYRIVVGILVLVFAAKLA